MKRNYQKLLFSSGNYLSFGFIHYFFSSLGQTFFLSVFVKYFVVSSKIDNAAFSWIYASATLSSAFILPFIGGIVDKVKLRYFSIVNGIVLSLFCWLISFSSNGILLFICLLGMRLTGQGLMPLIGSTSIARYFDKERGSALSLSSLGLSFSETIMPAIAIFLIGAFGWEIAWRIFSIGILTVFIPVVFFSVKKNDQFQHLIVSDSKQETEETKSRREVLKDRKFFMIIPAVVFIPFFMTGLFIHHNLLAEIKGWSMEWIASCFLGYGIFKIATTFVAGGLVDRFSAKRIFPFHLFPIAIGVCFLLMGSNKYYALAYLCFTGMSASLMSITTTAMWPEIYGYKHLGAIKSMVTTLVVFSSALGPLAMGYLLEDKDFWFYGLLSSLFVMLAVSMMASIALFPRGKLRLSLMFRKTFL